MKDEAHRHVQAKVAASKIPLEGTRLWHQRQQTLAVRPHPFDAAGQKEARARYIEDVKLHKYAEKGRV